MAKKKAKRKNYPTKLKVVNIKMPHDDFAQIQAKAWETHDGNVSALLREAGLGYRRARK